MATAPTTTTTPTDGQAAGPQSRSTGRPLAAAALVGAALLLGVVWAFVTPAFQAPDEAQHFGYVQSIVERGHLPGSPLAPLFSTEQNQALSDSNADQTAAVLATTMNWSRPAWDAWLSFDAGLSDAKRADTGGPNPAASNPPAYYVFASLAYRAARSGNLFARLETMRLFSLLWLIVTVTAAWLLSREVLRDELSQVAATGLVALAPMISFITSTVTPDGMLIALWTTALWLGTRILRRGITLASAVALFAVVGGATTVKATSYALIPAAMFVLVVGSARAHPRALRRIVPPVIGAAAALMATLGVWFVVARALARPIAAQIGGVATPAHVNIRQFLSYVWQFYLPRVPGETAFPTSGHGLPLYTVWIKGVWATFGWTEVIFRNRVYVLLSAVMLLVVVAAVSELWRTRRDADKAIGAYLVIATLTLLAGLHWTEYRLVIAGGGNFNQGRYLLPIVGIAGLVLGLAVRRLPIQRRGLATGVALGGLLTLQMLSLGLMFQRYYA